MKNDFIISIGKLVAMVILVCACMYSCAQGLDRAAAASAKCTPDMPAYRKPWVATGQTPCDWAGYECTPYENCQKCNVLVSTCRI